MGSINSVQFAFTQPSESAALASSPVGVASPRPTISSSLQDLVEISQVPSMAQLSPLETADPTEFHAVLSDTVRRLKEAVLQTTDPIESAYLSGLVDQFQRLEENGAAGLSTATAAGS